MGKSQLHSTGKSWLLQETKLRGKKKNEKIDENLEIWKDLKGASSTTTRGSPKDPVETRVSVVLRNPPVGRKPRLHLYDTWPRKGDTR